MGGVLYEQTTLQAEQTLELANGISLRLRAGYDLLGAAQLDPTGPDDYEFTSSSQENPCLKADRA